MTFHLAKFMEVNGHTSIIANYKILIGAQRLFFQLPVTSKLKIWFKKGLSVRVNDAVMDLHVFTWQADNAFEKHYVLTGHTDADDVETLRISPAVGQGINEAVISGFI